MDAISKTFNQLYGKPCWGIEWDRQLNLSLSFGDPILHVREPFESTSKLPKIRELSSRRRVTVKGAWWLWVFCSYWKISFDSVSAASSSSSYLQKSKAMSKLQGQILEQVCINPRSGATRFEFDLGGVLEVRRFERDSKDDLWILYKPSGYVLTIRGDGQYSHMHKSNMKEKWRPLQMCRVKSDI